MRTIIAISSLALLGACAKAEEPVYFVCSGIGSANETPNQIDEISGWTLALQRDQRGTYWGNATLEIPGAMLPDRYNFVTEAGQVLLLGKASQSNLGQFNRVTGALSLSLPAAKVELTCQPTAPLV